MAPRDLPSCPACVAGEHEHHDEFAIRTREQWVVCCCKECEITEPPLFVDPRLTSLPDRRGDGWWFVALLVGLAVFLAALVGRELGWFA